MSKRTGNDRRASLDTWARSCTVLTVREYTAWDHIDFGKATCGVHISSRE